MTSPTLAIQLFSLRSLDCHSAQFDLAAKAGFTSVEILEAHVTAGQTTRTNLDLRGLTAPSAHVSLDTLRNRPGEVVAGARTAGAKQLIVASPPFRAVDANEPTWRALGRELGGLAARLTDAGLTLCYHNHHWEVSALSEGSIPLDLILAEGSEGGLKWQADIAWLVRSGVDPVHWLDKYRDRVASIHVKDIALDDKAQEEDGWADVGHGKIDWATLWPKCLQSGAELMIAEHDNPSDPSRFARRAFTSMQQLASD